MFVLRLRSSCNAGTHQHDLHQPSNNSSVRSTLFTFPLPFISDTHVCGKKSCVTPPLLPSPFVDSAAASTTNSHPHQKRDNPPASTANFPPMFDFFNFSALRKKGKSHPQLSPIVSKRKGRAAAAAAKQHQKQSEDDEVYCFDSSAALKMVRHGKSNKFDCTNRRNEGVDLGKSIGDAALKELEKTRKDAARQVSKARKVSTGSLTGGEHEVTGVHTIDLVAPSKSITDEGVAARVEGLYAAM